MTSVLAFLQFFLTPETQPLWEDVMRETRRRCKAAIFREEFAPEFNVILSN